MNAEYKYNEIVNIGILRKKELFGDIELTYSQLRRLVVKTECKYEIHHIVPRYKIKHLSSKTQNASNNLTLLTAREHLLAHYYLSKFDTEHIHQARMAFIQLFNFKDRKCLEMSESEILELVDNLSETRKLYFGSQEHRDNSSKAGIISGKKRKERMAVDPEFRDYIVSRFCSKESKLKSLITKQNGLYTLPPWVRRCKTSEKQRWDLFDVIFVGVVEFGVSYKYISKYLCIPKRKISNIVRIIKLNPNVYNGILEDFKWYKIWTDEFEPNNKLVSTLRKMLNCPWNYRYFIGLKNLDIAYLEYKKSLKLSCAFLQSIGVITIHHSKYREYCEEIYKFKEFELWEYYDAWRLQKAMITSEFPDLNVHYTKEVR